MIAQLRSSSGAQFCGLAFDQADIGTLVTAILGGSAADPFAYLVTPNVDHLVRLHRAPAGSAFRRAYHMADLRICDSRVLAALARLAGVRLHPVPGSDLTQALLESPRIAEKSLAFIAADQAAADGLRAINPAKSLHVHIPPMGLADNPDAIAECVRFVRHCAADIVLIGVGSPQQEIVAMALKESGTAGGTALCIGSAVDFYTGRRRRAPRWMQKSALEWLFRLVNEPRQMWMRYLVRGPLVLPIVFRALSSRSQTPLFP